MAFQSSPKRKPQKILVDTDTKQVQINWQDGHTSVYHFTYLRRACPCAECQPWKEGASPVGVPPESVLTAIGDLASTSDVSLVGGYGIQFNWTDGHTFGIYDFGYLRELCPCPECSAHFEGEYRPTLEET